MKEAFYGPKDADLEHIPRRGGSSTAPPPRIIDPRSAFKFGVMPPPVDLIFKMMQAQVSGKERFDVLKQTFVKKEIPKKDTPFSFCNSWKKAYCPAGDVFLEIDISPGKTTKNILRPYEMPDIWSKHFFIIFGPFLDTFLKEVFPYHLHFIIKSSPFYPLPIPYMEFYMRGEYGNGVNLLADTSILDVGRRPLAE